MSARHEPPTRKQPSLSPAGEAREGELERSAWDWRFLAPELSLVLARHLAQASPDPSTASASPPALRVRVAEFLAECRLGRGPACAERACALLETVRAAGPTELEYPLLLELAGCAVSVGVPAAGIAALAGVLDRATPPPLRAVALLQLAKCVPYSAGEKAARDAIATAETLCHGQGEEVASIGLPLVELRAAVSLASARRARRSGELEAGLDATASGLELLAPGTGDSRAVRARLQLERVLILLAGGRRREACDHAEGPLSMPVRAAAAAPTSWLAIALARQVDLPAMRLGHAERHLRYAARLACRHELLAPAADALEGLADVTEGDGRADEALDHLRDAQLTTRRRNAVRAGARRALIAEFGVESSDAFAVSSEQLSQWLAAEAPGRDRRPPGAEPPAVTPVTASAARTNGEAEPGHPAHSQPSPGLAHLPGLVVTPGTGGRRRAPEPTEDRPREQAGTGSPGDVGSATPAGSPGTGSTTGDDSAMGMGELLSEALLALRSGEAASRVGDQETPLEGGGSGWPRRTVDPDDGRY